MTDPQFAATVGAIAVIGVKLIDLIVNRWRETHAEEDTREARFVSEASDFRRELRADLETLHKRNDDLVEENAGFRNEIVELRAKVRQLEYEGATLKRDNELLKAQHLQCQTKIEALEAQVLDMNRRRAE